MTRKDYLALARALGRAWRESPRHEIGRRNGSFHLDLFGAPHGANAPMLSSDLNGVSRKVAERAQGASDNARYRLALAVIESVSAELASDNARFDSERFREAVMSEMFREDTE